MNKDRCEIQRELNNLRIKLRSELLEQTIDHFHEEVHTFIVEQMRGVVLAPDALTPLTIEYKLEERATVAKLLFELFDDLDEDYVLQVRIELVKNLAQLCKRQETPR